MQTQTTINIDSTVLARFHAAVSPKQRDKLIETLLREAIAKPTSNEKEWEKLAALTPKMSQQDHEALRQIQENLYDENGF